MTDIFNCTTSSVSSEKFDAQVSAVDEDKDDRVEYALLGETHGLQIEPRTGLVTVGPEARISNIGKCCRMYLLISIFFLSFLIALSESLFYALVLSLLAFSLTLYPSLIFLYVAIYFFRYLSSSPFS